MKYKNIFWGVLFVCIGALFLLRNLNLVDFNWEAILYLWPILFVLWGISLLPIKGWIKLILSFLSIILGFVLVDTYEVNYSKHFRFDFEQEDKDRRDRDEESLHLDQKFSEPFDAQISEARFKLDAVAGKYQIYGGSNNLIDFKRSGNVGNYSLITKDLSKSKKEVKISMNNGDFHDIKGNRNKINIDLNDQVEWDCDIDFGAADIYADFSHTKIKLLKLDGGASNAEFKMGSLYPEVIIDIDAGVTNITLRIPKEAGCKIDSDGFMANKDLEGFIKTSKGNYRTRNYDKSTVKFKVKLDAALSNLDVIRY